ncbi:MAG: NAD-glutamate dehydrogenase, partial [Gammaproteobacteria bacterium]
AYMEQTLHANPGISRMLVELFEARFEPRGGKQRDSRISKLNDSLDTALDEVASLDDDRILRGFLGVIRATLRTNYYQRDADGEYKQYLSFKFDPAKVPDLPLPRPMFEIFVYSPRVEGVHLRGGKVARGGLRWSDRREDFRTEVLGLMKAQQVKNTLIVPVGAKGGFVVKQPPAREGREALMSEVVFCYKTFISGLLDITDNIVDGDIVPPRDVVRHDEDDPYLVVAADKGTATFSDIANGVARDYGFWLGDAFASGGSAGYDHKKMGITAKGGWESVKRHFREMGIDIQSTDFSAVGIGDMGGDVFGNGMLLSRHTRLKAAFNHMHIFLDPDPDPAASFEERQRLFNLPRSTWADYNPDLISKGGGVYPRSAKSIKVTPEVREALGIDAASLTPQELIRAILKAPVDLLWNGGIGTYVKSIHESNSDAGDRANDGVRVNGSALRCRVVGEGGNLGFTQLGRIEYAMRGGRINTDFIDNSAGVDCSDREVNIKILLNLATTEGTLGEEARNKLLAEMTDEVSELVLRDNYMQAQAVSITESQAAMRINEHAYLIRILERNGALDRALEFLPTEEELVERRAASRGLTRPELAVLLAYSKITIYSELLNSDVPEDPYLSGELESYFPAPLTEHYKALMPQHRLRREIIATAITNSMANRMGPTFAHRMQEDTGSSAASVAKAYTIAREAYDMRNLWSAVEALDNAVPASVQTAMMVQTARLLKHATRWLLDRPHRHSDIAVTVSEFAPGIAELNERITDFLGPHEMEVLGETMQQYMDVGVPEVLARRIASLGPLYAAFDMVDVAAEQSLGISTVAATYFTLGSQLDLNWLREQIEHLPVEGHWQAVARGTLRENLYAYQRELTALILEGHAREDDDDLVEGWMAQNEYRVQHALRIISDMRTTGNLDFATASVALQEVRKLSRTEGISA